MSDQHREPREGGIQEHEPNKGRRQELNERRQDRGGHIGSGDAREQADHEEFDRGEAVQAADKPKTSNALPPGNRARGKRTPLPEATYG